MALGGGGSIHRTTVTLRELCIGRYCRYLLACVLFVNSLIRRIFVRIFATSQSAYARKKDAWLHDFRELVRSYYTCHSPGKLLATYMY